MYRTSLDSSRCRSDVRLARVEDYRAQVATLSLNFFHFPLPLTLQPTESYPHASISWIDACRRDSSMEDH